MKLAGVELRRISMPLVAPFRTSFGVESTRDILLLRAVLAGSSGESEGWGECVALSDPLYSSEYVDAAVDVLKRFMLPRLFAAGHVDGAAVGPLLAPFKGHWMSKAAIETAVLDAELRAAGRSFARELGATRDRVPCGVSVGIHADVPALLDTVAGYLDAGYVRVKLKIEPGWDIEPVRAVRERFGDDLLIQVDANTAYTLRDARHLARLDEFNLLLMEQPLPEEDVLGHAALARLIATPVCLDESITSARTAAAAITLGACSIINIKPGRVGGYLEARRIHDLCQAHGVAVWCGGMLETGLGRAANVALAALPGFTLPGDTSASDRYYQADITDPFVLSGGHLPVPAGPGLGVTPLPDRLAAVTTWTDWVAALRSAARAGSFLWMTMRPQPSLHRVLDDLGATLLELVCAPSPPWAGPDEIGGVAIHDPVDEPVLPRRALVLGVGVHAPADVAALLTALGAHRAAGLVVRAPATCDDAVAAAVEESGVPLLSLTRGASWTQLAALLRSLLAEGDVGDPGPETLGGLPSGDLFSVANAVAALIDAPVTIEDRSSRVLAFSGRQDEADRSRVETVLGRQVPERYSRHLAERGVFRDLYRSEQPVYVEPPPAGMADFVLPRAAVTVRAGDEVLGSIWAVVREPLTPDRARAMCDAARLVALHLLRIRAGADVSRRLRADLVSTALEGGTGAFDAVRRLGLADQPVVVLALAVADPAERARLADGLAMHLSAIHPRCAAALVGDVAYGLVPVVPGPAGPDGAAADGADGEQRAVRIAAGFLDRVGERSGPVIGIGQVAFDAAGLPAARTCADRALRVLRAGTGPAGGRRVARLADVHAEALLMELRDLAAAHGDRPTGPVARLSAYDAEHGTSLVETLRAWLDAFGDVAAASAAMFVHPNTFRYRLRRLTEVSGIDLGDPEQRFAAMLQLRAVGPAARGPG